MSRGVSARLSVGGQKSAAQETGAQCVIPAAVRRVPYPFGAGKIMFSHFPLEHARDDWSSKLVVGEHAGP